MSSTGAPNSTASAAPAQQAGGGHGGEEEFNISPLMYHVNLFLLAVFATFVLLRLPRFFARFWKPSEWLNGHILRYVRPPVPAGPRIVHTTHNATSPYADHNGSSVESHTLYDHIAAVRMNEKGGNATPSYPPHVGAGASLFAPLMGPLRVRVVPGFSVAQFVVLCGWFALLVYPTLYKSSGPFTDPVRAGWVGTAQLPFVFAFASKNNILGHFLGLGYEKVRSMAP